MKCTCMKPGFPCQERRAEGSVFCAHCRDNCADPSAHRSEWTGLRCIRKDCDGVGHISQASAFSEQESHFDGEEEVG